MSEDLPPENPDPNNLSHTSQITPEEYAQRRNTAYSHAIELIKFEGEMLWTILSVFLVVNTILLGFIGQYIATNQTSVTENGSWPCLIGALMGLVLCIPFYGTFVRNSKYYKFRMEQAKAYEDPLFPLLRKQAKKFSEGKKAKANGKEMKLNWIAREMANKVAASWMIVLFVLAYLSILIYALPKCHPTKDFKPVNKSMQQKTLSTQNHTTIITPKSFK
ncbi:hypothetical protein QWY86_03195 [Pedobacter aquatilis]|uniref:RipA family octameric membrane protein n=1 Tax=Pedobacter aquatilis TaxID=351343 RepID=UPI0025B2AEFF|nr:hypothetical protein [Pedobacter aquatilis]MDN3585657.1 hypothetical protein [Pedobacter aquatilis]